MNLRDLRECDGTCNILNATKNIGIQDAVNSFQRLQSFVEHPETAPMQLQCAEYLLAREIGEMAQTIQYLVKLQQATRDFRISCETVSKLRK
jgi:cation transport regulator ChaC